MINHIPPPKTNSALVNCTTMDTPNKTDDWVLPDTLLAADALNTLSVCMKFSVI